MLPKLDASVTAIARLLGVSPDTLYNHIPDRQDYAPSAGRAGNVPPAPKTERLSPSLLDHPRLIW